MVHFTRRTGKAFFTAAAGILLSGSIQALEPEIKSGVSIAFMGDSISDMGFWDSGYCKLVIHGLKANGIVIKGIHAGVCNQSSRQMIKRIDSVIRRKPQVLTLNSGVNDIGQRVPLAEYKKNMTEMVERAQKAGIIVYIVTASLVREKLDNATNTRMLPYNEFLRELAKSHNCKLAEVNIPMKEARRALEAKYPKMKDKNMLTKDGLHMTIRGDMVMAKALLQAFGLTEQQIEVAEKAWQKRIRTVPYQMDVSTYNEITKRAMAENISVDANVARMIENELKKEGNAK